ncbi:hypothetical protein SO802_018549 [Lithocarpus litseifolius]|uniref:Uncharacterized protein n=1 Tax=Lithocarpus litseifolius TaxID=425828 RepID=A0AAW2CLK4_9ROSI
MASHFLFGIPFPFASTSTHPNHGCTLCSDCLIPGGLVFDYVMEVWDPPDTINLGIMCSARVTSRSHCTEFAFLGMEGFGKRWLWVMSTKNSPTEICLVWYCQLLDSMHPNQVVWQPYEAEFGHLPAYCLSGREMWTARVPLIASHKQLLMHCIVSSLDYKQITDVLKAVDRLHCIIAHLPMQNTNKANLEAPKDTGQPSTSSTPANHSYGRHAAPNQAELINPAVKGTNHGICTLSWHQHKHIIAFISGPSQVMVRDYEDSVIFGELANLVAYMFAPAVLVTPLGALSIIVRYSFNSSDAALGCNRIRTRFYLKFQIFGSQIPGLTME